MRTLTDPDPAGGDAGGDAAGPYLTLALDRTRAPSLARRYELTGLDRLVLGRGDRDVAAVDGRTLRVTVADPVMSERHLVIERAGDGWSASDPGSKNGTLLDGERLARATVADGAVIEAGRCFFVFRAAAAGARGPRELTVTELDGRPDALVTFQPRLRRPLELAERIAASKVPVLVLGETGTGKDVMARALHEVSGRPGDLVTLNCGALPANLLESTLFGYRKGAFSGATEDRPGLVRAAHRGTLFLDEIGELSPAGQVALLRVLEAGEVLPIGETRPVAVDVRIVAATLRDLRLAAAGGGFRDDLLARLAGHVVETTPLRARREDLGLLLARLGASGRLPWPTGVPLSRAAAQLLFAHRWPHNIRELVHAFDAALVIGPERGELPVHAFEGALSIAPPPAAEPAAAADPRDEAGRLRALLAEHGGNLSAVARALATSRTQVARLLARYAIDAASYR